jgi:5'-3' exonuclease
VIYLVDASVFIFRAYYSVPIEMTDSAGNPVNALHGFARFLGDLIERESPDYLAVAFDESLETSFRNEIYPAYKANRDPAPPELKRQFSLCRRACRAMGIVEFASGRYEADDIIGTLVYKARSAGRPVTIVSRDKDLTQLLSGQDTYWDAVADIRYSHADIEEKFGASPERMADLLALMGDASDNIPGVPGVGRKTAARLLKHFDHIDGVYANLENVPKLKFRGAASVAERLRQHRDTALLSRRLTGIACDMPIDVEVEGLRRASPDLEELDRCYDEAGFGRMLRNQARRIAGETADR